jgi:hypothetical protein
MAHIDSETLRAFLASAADEVDEARPITAWETWRKRLGLPIAMGAFGALVGACGGESIRSDNACGGGDCIERCSDGVDNDHDGATDCDDDDCVESCSGLDGTGGMYGIPYSGGGTGGYLPPNAMGGAYGIPTGGLGGLPPTGGTGGEQLGGTGGELVGGTGGELVGGTGGEAQGGTGGYDPPNLTGGAYGTGGLPDPGGTGGVPDVGGTGGEALGGQAGFGFGGAYGIPFEDCDNDEDDDGDGLVDCYDPDCDCGAAGAAGTAGAGFGGASATGGYIPNGTGGAYSMPF